MAILSVDIETYSSVNLAKSGVYAYTEAPDFEILLFGYAFDDGPVHVVDIADGEVLPANMDLILTGQNIIKTAFNANFERICISKFFGLRISPESWRCTAVHALTLGLPGKLEEVAKVMKLKAQKDTAGKNLIRYFSVPCKPTKANGMGTRNLPQHAPEKWAQFKAYCAQDVEVERSVRKALERFPVPQKEQKLWCLDQKINDTGILVDPRLVANAITCDTAYQERLVKEAVKLTGLDNPNSVAQLKAWLLEAEGLEVESLNKETVPELLKQAESDTVKRVLELRQEMAKTSIKKYQAMDRARCKDNRIRGLLQFYGANRTGRWAGRLVQVQNLPQNKLPDLDLARQLLLASDYDTLEMLFDSVPMVLSQLIRTAFIPAPGCKFIVADFSAIEARVIAWLAGEKWRLDVFQTHGKIYEASAAAMFKVPIESIDKGSPMRQKGKVAELACIAEGQLVLTDIGLVPIEEITLQHQVWDGEEFVRHEGLICRGFKEVMTYEGLTATPNHFVWIEGQSEPVRFKDAATSGAHLLRTGIGRQAVRVGGDYQPGKEMEKRLERCSGAEYRGKAKVYDILNAGPRHRFTVSNCLVHNCGYQGGPGALVSMGALKMGLKEEELPGIIKAWRAASPNIVQFWYDVERAALEAVREKKAVSLQHGLTFSYESGIMFIRLPSGRRLAYVRPRIENDPRFDKPVLTYEGTDQKTKQWGRLNTYGGKLVENIVQATARDCLAEAMLRLDEAGYRIVMHVHDEVVLEVPEGTGSLEEACEITGQAIPWAPGLPMRADGFETYYYKKDD